MTHAARTASPSGTWSRNVRLARAARADVSRWSAAAYPYEACGLLLGTCVGPATAIDVALLGRNLAGADGRDRFLLDPADYLHAVDLAHARGLAIVGAWHSHPDRPATASAADAAAAWPQWCQLIVSVVQGRVHDIGVSDKKVSDTLWSKANAPRR
jgi:proteasome lid subunit RPN8/RPN11